MKTLFDKDLVKCNRPKCFSFKQWYQLLNKFVHAYFLRKNTWKYIRFHYQITVNYCVQNVKYSRSIVHKPRDLSLRILLFFVIIKKKCKSIGGDNNQNSASCSPFSCFIYMYIVKPRLITVFSDNMYKLCVF